MAELSTTTVFGTTFTQNATDITFKKADLQSILSSLGIAYTPTASDTAEKIFSAILLACSANLNVTNRAADYTTRNVEIVFPTNPTIINQGGVNWQQDTYQVKLYKSYSLPSINIADY